MGVLKLENAGLENKQGYNGPLQGADITNRDITDRYKGQI